MVTLTIINDESTKMKVGIASSNGDILLPPIYDDIIYYDDDLFIVRLNYKYAVIRSDKKIIVDFGEYEYIDGFVKKLARVKKDGKWGLIDERGFTVARPVFDEIWKLRDDLNTTRAVYNGEFFYIRLHDPKDPERQFTNPIHFYSDVTYKLEEYPELGLSRKKEYDNVLDELAYCGRHHDGSSPLDAFEGDEELYSEWLEN